MVKYEGGRRGDGSGLRSRALVRPRMQLDLDRERSGRSECRRGLRRQWRGSAGREPGKLRGERRRVHPRRSVPQSHRFLQELRNLDARMHRTALRRGTVYRGLPALLESRSSVQRGRGLHAGPVRRAMPGWIPRVLALAVRTGPVHAGYSNVRAQHLSRGLRAGSPVRAMRPRRRLLYVRTALPAAMRVASRLRARSVLPGPLQRFSVLHLSSRGTCRRRQTTSARCATATPGRGACRSTPQRSSWLPGLGITGRF